LGRPWTADIPGLTTTTFVEIQRVQPRTIRLSAVPRTEMVRGYRGYKVARLYRICRCRESTGYSYNPRRYSPYPLHHLYHRNKKKEKQMDTLRQLASSLGLSSEPRPAPPTPPIQPNANDSSIPTEQPDTAPARHIVTAATASNEWRQARDQYLNHLMACRACNAPTGRHCAAGSALSQQYCSTPMESLDEPERTVVPRPVSLRSPELAVSVAQSHG